MLRVFNSAVRACGRVGLGSIVFTLVATVASTVSLAQSAQSPVISSASSRSLQSAIDDQTNETINQSAAGSGQPRPGVGAFPTGRFRFSNHDGFDVSKGAVSYGATATTGFKTEERSGFFTGTYLLPEAVLGGRLQFGALAGFNSLSVNQTGVLFGQTGTSRNESFLFGGSALLAFGPSYVLVGGYGFVGDTEIDELRVVTNQRTRFEISTSGGMGNAVVGTVVELGGGLKLDARQGISYIRHEGDAISNLETPEFASWQSTSSLMVFSILPAGDGAIVRPYIQGNFKYLFGYENVVKFTPGNPAFNETWEFDQVKAYGGVEFGLNHVKGPYTMGLAAYVDGSQDETNIGGRFGVTVKFD